MGGFLAFGIHPYIRTPAQREHLFYHIIHVKWVPFHDGMASPDVAGRGNDIQMWWVAAVILDKQSTADKGWFLDWGLSGRLTISYRKQINVLRNIKHGFGPL